MALSGTEWYYEGRSRRYSARQHPGHQGAAQDASVLGIRLGASIAVAAHENVEQLVRAYAQRPKRVLPAVG